MLGGADRERRRNLSEILELRHARGLELAGRDDRNRERHALDVLGALLRGDDDLARIRNGLARAGRALRLHGQRTGLGGFGGIRALRERGRGGDCQSRGQCAAADNEMAVIHSSPPLDIGRRFYRPRDLQLLSNGLTKCKFVAALALPFAFHRWLPEGCGGARITVLWRSSD
ncbi:MAG: hypothetical protein WDN44_07255 [Sphingomonas sp.]